MSDKIDFVITWVNGNDPQWQKERDAYAANEHIEYYENNARFRDWDTLKYWFRGVEKYAPWANKIFFVTWGHLPDWLDINHPKLQIINHSAFIPAEYLPTFNSNVIEYFFHKINGILLRFLFFSPPYIHLIFHSILIYLLIRNKIKVNSADEEGVEKDVERSELLSFPFRKDRKNYGRSVEGRS